MIKFIGKLVYYVNTIIYLLIFYRLFKFRFGMFGYRSRLFSPLQIQGWSNIYIEDRVIINYKTWLAAVPHTNTDDCKLIIRKGTIIGNFNHIYATNRIEIGEFVLTADKVYISDNIHGYSNIRIPILKQPIIQKNKVKIGSGSWIGENVCIIGASIGKNCVIGANSVVTKDIPDYSIAVGNPAKVIKVFNSLSGIWERV